MKVKEVEELRVLLKEIREEKNCTGKFHQEDINAMSVLAASVLLDLADQLISKWNDW